MKYAKQLLVGLCGAVTMVVLVLHIFAPFAQSSSLLILLLQQLSPQAIMHTIFGSLNVTIPVVVSILMIALCIKIGLKLDKS